MPKLTRKYPTDEKTTTKQGRNDYTKLQMREFRAHQKSLFETLIFYGKRLDAQQDRIAEIVQPDFTSEISGNPVKEFERNQKVILFLDSKVKALQFNIDLSRVIRSSRDIDFIVHVYETSLGKYEKFLKELQEASDKLKEI
jgi:hypothetical protein